MVDSILAFIEKWSSKINIWAWDLRWKDRKYTTEEEWIEGYSKWKKKNEMIALLKLKK